MTHPFMRSCAFFLLASAFGAASFAATSAPAPHAPPLARAQASGFGLTADADFFTVDTGAGLVFKVRRLDNGVSTQSAGDIASLVYNGVEYQDQTRGSQVNSGFDYLYQGVSAVSVTAKQVDADHIRVTVKAGDLTHYYLAQRGVADITMGTVFKTEPNTLNLARYIVRVPIGLLPDGPPPSDLRGNTGAIESSDIFGMPDGTTRSKHYSNMRLKDWSFIGATGSHVGLWIVRDDNEGNSGGPFFRSLLNQGADDQEITYIINYGENQTEPFRTGILNTYTLVFTDGRTPGPVDSSWLAGMDLTGYVAPAARGEVAGVGIAGRDGRHAYTVGFSNTRAQYWADASAVDGSFACTGMLPGTYTMKIYKGELAVDTRTVTVAAGGKTALHTITIAGDPSAQPALWRIGDWDGSPAEFLNGGKVTTMHPSDARMAPWTTPDFVVGASNPATAFPAYQWKGVNGAVDIRFNLSASQLAAYTLRAGITTAYAGGRPTIRVNGWSSPIPQPSTQPASRTLTVGSYRGNNTMFSYPIPSGVLVVGQNTVTLEVASGSSGTAFLSPGYSLDAVDLVRTP